MGNASFQFSLNNVSGNSKMYWYSLIKRGFSDIKCVLKELSIVCLHMMHAGKWSVKILKVQKI